MQAKSFQREFMGHPIGLSVLFLTETWERFSFYGMRALLVYYMTRGLDIAQAHASLIYGAYTAMIYFTPIFGGWIADRWLGNRRAVIIGAATMALGHFMMVFEPLFYVALIVLAIGNGFFLPSLASQIRGLYRSDDPRGKSAYNIYYVGVNIGAFVAPLVCGFLGERYGWHWGFAMAGIGMLTSLVFYLTGLSHLPPEPARRALASSQRTSWVPHRQTLLLLMGVAAIVVVFRGAYEQVGNTIALWAEVDVNRDLGSGWSIPMAWFQSLNALSVFLLTPVLLARWDRLAKRGVETPLLHKMAFGALVVSVSYLTLAAVTGWTEAHATHAHWAWLVGWFVLMTLGELYILPTGLGLFGRMAPEGLRATCIALWYFAGFFGNLLAGTLGTLWSKLPHAEFFVIIAGVASAAAVLLFLVGRRVGHVERRAPSVSMSMH
jgi:POT family proton-dependent oligopeptide transporter